MKGEEYLEFKEEVVVLKSTNRTIKLLFYGFFPDQK